MSGTALAKPVIPPGFDAFHYVAIDTHSDGSLTVGPGQVVVDGVDVGADENDKRIEQSGFSLVK
jgi:hypothetical protein